jgi:hypothetical protein
LAKWIVGAMFAGLGTGTLGAGFLYVDGTFTPINVPGAQFDGTGLADVNNVGQIVGNFVDRSGSDHGFIYTRGTFTTIDAPGAFATFVQGINDAGDIVGRFDDKTGVHGFVRVGTMFRTIALPGAQFVLPTGINNTGRIVGYFVDSAGRIHGFIDDKGTISRVDAPGVDYVTPGGINDQGDFVGMLFNNGNVHAFLNTGGKYSFVDVPGSAFSASPNDINNAGDIVGAVGTEGYVDIDGTFSFLKMPGAHITRADGINDAGEIVGTGALVPEPNSLVLFGVVLLVAGATRLLNSESTANVPSRRTS